jgi:hypothetical protein
MTFSLSQLRPMFLWNVYQFEFGGRGLVRRLICRDLNASSDKAAIDTVCKHITGAIRRESLFAREARTDDWQAEKQN